MIRTLNDLKLIYRTTHVMLLAAIVFFSYILYHALWDSDNRVNALLASNIADPIAACAAVNCSYADINGMLYTFSAEEYDINHAAISSIKELPWWDRIGYTKRDTLVGIRLYTDDYITLSKVLLLVGLPVVLIISIILGIYVERRLTVVAQHEVSAASAESDRESDLKALIAATAHHEMLAPIAVIKTGLEGACGEGGCSLTPSAYKLVNASICRLEAVLQQMSRDRKIHSGRNVTLYTIIEDTLSSLDVLYTGVNFKHHVTNTALLKNARCYKLCSGTISNILNNLFKNSLEAGATELTVAANASNGIIDLYVMDNGSGIPGGAERVNAVFDLGYSNKDSENLVTANKKLNVDKDTRGNGLYLARTILNSSGGELIVAATGPTGTMFKMSIPYKPITGDEDDS